MPIHRNNLKYLVDHLNKPEILILLGARQVGKTTLMKMLEKNAEKVNKKTLFFNLEIPQDLHFFSKSDEEIYSELTAQNNAVIFIDEFHYLKNASKLFKSIFDSNKRIKIIASGSSSIEIHKHLKESLAGRRVLVRVFPFNLEELKKAKKNFQDLMIWGGLPGLLKLKNKTDKIEYLSQMVQAYLLKDVKGLIKDENIRAFNHLLFYLAEHQGSILPVANLASEIGLSAKTVENYLEILEQTFVIYSLNSFSKKMANELKKSKKYYFYDNGIRNSLIKDFKEVNVREDNGVLFESAIFVELKNKQTANVEIRFWRTKQNDEIDFLWIRDRVITPIEVKLSANNDRVPSGMIKFMRNYPEVKIGYVVCLDRKEIVKIDNTEVQYLQLEDLLEVIREE